MSEEPNEAGPGPLPRPPDAAPVNEALPAPARPRAGLRGLADRLVARLLGPQLEAQHRFDARQVQLDNELLRYLGERFGATHEHYDRLLAQQGRRLDEVDERHRRLEQELVRHVRDLVTRIDLVLAEANREKLALAFALEQARERLARLEEALRRG